MQESARFKTLKPPVIHCLASDGGPLFCLFFLYSDEKRECWVLHVSQSVKGAVMLPILSWPKARDTERERQRGGEASAGHLFIDTPCNKNFMSETWSF